MADELKRGYLRPRFSYGYDHVIDRMSERIDELEAENERLRAAGDALEHSLLMWQSKHPHLDLGYDALAAWQKARRA